MGLAITPCPFVYFLKDSVTGKTAQFRLSSMNRASATNVMWYYYLFATTQNIGEMLSSSLAKQKSTNRHCLLKVILCLKFSARQGCAIRGHKDLDDGNFYQLMKLKNEDDSKVKLVLLLDVKLYNAYSYTYSVVIGLPNRCNVMPAMSVWMNCLN